jgi:hypothetical protein
MIFASAELSENISRVMWYVNMDDQLGRGMRLI